MLVLAVIVIYPAILLFQASFGEAPRAWRTFGIAAAALAGLAALGLLAEGLLGKGWPSGPQLLEELTSLGLATLCLLAVALTVIGLAAHKVPVWLQAVAAYLTMAAGAWLTFVADIVVCTWIRGPACVAP